MTVCVAALFVLFVSFRVIDQQRWGGVTLSAVALIGLGIVLGGHFLERHDSTKLVEVDMSNIQHVSFREKPNLYFISFESLVPRSLLRKHFGLDTSPFHDLFEANFRRFPNFFSDDTHTTASLNMILALDKEIFVKSSSEYSLNLFSGVQPSHCSAYCGIMDTKPVRIPITLRSLDATKVPISTTTPNTVRPVSAVCWMPRYGRSRFGVLHISERG